VSDACPLRTALIFYPKLKMGRKLINALECEKYIQRKLFAFNAGKTLARAWNAGENVLLTGPGGYGKTDGAYSFFEYLKSQEAIMDENPYILAFGQGMTEERLFAGLDIKKFQSEGELVYNLKKAFVNYEYVIFEELFDAFPGVLLILKDVLQSKSVRLGDTVFPLRTKFIVACTNRSNEEVATDRSTWALLERFVFQKEVTWTSWEKSDYLSAFEAATGQKADAVMEAVARIAAASSKGEMKISPRTAGKGLKAVKQNGNDITVLEDILGFDKKSVREVFTAMEGIAADKTQRDHVAAVVALCKQTAATSSNSAIKLAVAAKRVHVELEKLSGIQRRDANVELFEESIIVIENLRESLWQRAKSLINKPPVGSLAEFIQNSSTSSFDWSLLR
jgi:MoxR-like ATPase